MFADSSAFAMGEPMKIPTPFASWNAVGFTQAQTWNMSKDSCMGEPMKLSMPPYSHSPSHSQHADARAGRILSQRVNQLMQDSLAKAEPQDGYDSSDSTSCGLSTESVKSSSRFSEDVLEEPDHLLALDRLSLTERAELILPVASEWAQLMGLKSSSDSIAQLRRLINEHPATQERSKKRVAERVTGAELRELRLALKGLPLPELVSMLKPEEAPPSVQISMETLVCEMQFELQKIQKKQASKMKHCRGRKQASGMK